MTLRTAEERPRERPEARGGSRRPRAGLPLILVGFAIIVIAVLLRTNETFCDPGVSRCVVVVDGVATGETVAEQRADADAAMFFTALIGLVFMVPGFWMLYRRLVRSSGEAEAPNQRRPD